MKLGDKIRIHRKAKGLTQTELGKMLGVKVNAVSKWECGRVEDIPTSKIKALANIFDVSPSYLIDDEKDSLTLSKEALDFIEVFNQLTPSEQEVLLDTAKALLRARLKT